MTLLDIEPYLDLDEEGLERSRGAYPKFLQRVCPEWVTPLHDFAVGDTWYKWFKLARQFGDLDLVECGKPCDVPPAWKEEEHDWRSLLEDREEVSLSNDWATWGLKHGVCPGQPFLVEMAGPHVYGGGYYSEDYEVEYALTIVRRMPRTPQEALRSWDKHRLTEKALDQKTWRRYIQKIKLTKDRPDRWKLEFDFWSLRLYTTYNLGDRETTYTLASANLIKEGTHVGSKCKAETFHRLVKNFLRDRQNYPIGPLLDLAHSIDVPMDRYTRIRLESLHARQNHAYGRPIDQRFL